MPEKLLRPGVLLPVAVTSGAMTVAMFGRSLGILSWRTVLLILVLVLVLVALGLLAWWLARRHRSTTFGTSLDEQARRKAAEAVDEQTREKMEEFRRNVRTLSERRAPSGESALYYLPWFLLVGPPGVGKTVLIQNSGLLPCISDKDVFEPGPTEHWAWWFTNQGIFLDTAGRYTKPGSLENQEEWRSLLRMLQRFRRKRPIDGMIVAIAADELRTWSAQEIQTHAAEIRKHALDRAARELRLRFPVFVVITKTDTLLGFTEFVKALPPAHHFQILGWTNPQGEYTGPDGVAAAFDVLAEGLRARRLQLLAESNSVDQRRNLVLFPEEWRLFREPLVAFLDALFGGGGLLSSRPMHAGTYFTSGQQTGNLISEYFRKLAQELDLPPEEVGGRLLEEKRPYFVSDLFFKVVARTRGCVERLGVERLARRRAIAGASVAGAATLAALLTLLSYGNNAAFLARYPRQLSAELARIRGAGWPSLAADMRQFQQGVMPLLDELERRPLAHDFGLNSRSGLHANATAASRAKFDEAIWAPVRKSFSRVLGGQTSCAARVRQLRSFLDLTDPGADEAAYSEALRALKLEGLDARALKTSWSWFVTRTGGRPTLLSNLDLCRSSAEVIGSCVEFLDPLRAYLRVQAECSGEPGPGCFERLDASASMDGEAVADAARDLKAVRASLLSYGCNGNAIPRIGDGGGADRGVGGPQDPAEALDVLDGEGAIDCGRTFAKVQPVLARLVAGARIQKRDYDGAKGQPQDFQLQQARVTSWLDGEAAAIGAAFATFNAGCSAHPLDPTTPLGVARGWLFGHGSGVAPEHGGGGAPCTSAAGFTPEAWTSVGQCLTGRRSQATLPEAAQIRAEGRSYSSAYEQRLRSDLGRPAPLAGDGVNVLRGAGQSIRQRVQRALLALNVTSDAAVGMQAPAELKLELESLDRLLDEYEQAAQAAAKAIDEAANSGRVPRDPGLIAPVCEIVERVPARYRSLFRTPVVTAWNEVVLGGTPGDEVVRWDKTLREFGELGTRYPFRRDAAAEASRELLVRWFGAEGALAALRGEFLSTPGDLPCGVGGRRARLGELATAFLDRGDEVGRLLLGGDARREPAVRMGFEWLAGDPSGYLDNVAPDIAHSTGVRIADITLILNRKAYAFDTGQVIARVQDVPLPLTGGHSSLLVRLVGKRQLPQPRSLESDGEWSALRFLDAAAKEWRADGRVVLTWRIPVDLGKCQDCAVRVALVGDQGVARVLRQDFFSLEPPAEPSR